MVLWENNKEKLLDLGNQLQFFFENELQLVLKPFCLNKTEKGLPFLGYVLTKHSLHLNKRSRKRFRKKIVLYESNRKNNKWTEIEYQKHMLPLLAFTQKADSYHFRKKIVQHYDF
jgi:RNA-directed DNA polymerase